MPTAVLRRYYDRIALLCQPRRHRLLGLPPSGPSRGRGLDRGLWLGPVHVGVHGRTAKRAEAPFCSVSAKE